MKVDRVRVRGYRSLEDFELEIDNYCVLIGPNGSGKSTLLYALDWFVNGSQLTKEDLFRTRDDGYENSTRIEVEVQFGALNARDRELLHEYGKGSTATFRKSWDFETNQTKVVGKALQGPGFSVVRSKSRVGEIRDAYKQLQGDVQGLQQFDATPSKEAILESLQAWEDDAENSSLLVDVLDSEANHMFGINGPNIIKSLVQLILVPAGTDLAAEVGAANKGSVLSSLIGALTQSAGIKAKESWDEENKGALEDLGRRVTAEVNAATASATNRTNAALKRLVPGASVAFKPNEVEVDPRIVPSVSTTVTMDSLTTDVSRQGHGVQRAVMMSVLQALAVRGDGDGEKEGPSLIICVEEPEIFQHPVRARGFAQVLTALASNADTQVVLGTHSPYFVRPEQFENLRRLSVHEGRSVAVRTAIGEVSSKMGIDAKSVRKQVHRWFPTEFAEGFFADAAVLVEGDTDPVILEAVSETLGRSLALGGVAVLNMGGKNNLRLAYEVLVGLEVPTYVLFDGDAGTHMLKPDSKQAGALASNRDSTDKILAWIPVDESNHHRYSFGDETYISQHFTALKNDIEHELDKWPSFRVALQAVGGQLRTKHASTYRAACAVANTQDLPDSIRDILANIAEFAGVNSKWDSDGVKTSRFDSLLENTDSSV